MKYLAILALGPLVHGLLSPAPAAACSCGKVEIDTAIEGAAAIFEGRLDRIGTPEEGSIALDFALVRVWKGELGERATVFTAEQSSACRFPGQVGETYLVYAQEREGGGLGVHACSRSRPIVEADEDLGRLGAGVVPVDPTPPGGQPVIAPTPERPANGGCASCAVGAGRGDARGLWLVVAAAGYLWMGRRRATRGQFRN